MRIVLQRVNQASVEVEGNIVGKIDRGLLLLVGVAEGDGEATLGKLAKKIANLRIFPDEQGRFHHSLLEIDGPALAVSQFTLYADTRKGRRPEFFAAAKPDLAEPLFDQFCEELKKAGIKQVETGSFGAHMKVALENDGPVTIILDSET